MGLVKDSKFLKHDGSWGQLGRYAVDKGVLSNGDLLNLLIESGLWTNAERNPAVDLGDAFELAKKHNVFSNNVLTEKQDCWAIGLVSAPGMIDVLAFGLTPQRAICLYMLRFPEIDRCYNDLPYAGWSTRYEDKELGIKQNEPTR